MKVNKYYAFKHNVLGKAIDVDGAFGIQCWDLYAQYCKFLGVPVMHCTESGFVKDIWRLRKSNGILNDFKEVKELEAGDIVVFKEVKGLTPYSHIAIFDSDIDGKYGYFLGQNQGGTNGAANIVKFPYSATYSTAFRLKNAPEVSNVVENVPEDFIKEQGTATVTVSAIRIREQPSMTGKDTGLRYNKGQSVNYDGFVKREGYVWISWISDSTKTRRWMAAGELNNMGVNVKPYCTFK